MSVRAGLIRERGSGSSAEVGDFIGRTFENMKTGDYAPMRRIVTSKDKDTTDAPEDSRESDGNPTYI